MMSSPALPIIDFHAHVLEAEATRQSAGSNVVSGFGQFPRPGPGSRFAEIEAKMLDPAAHIEDMDRLGIDVEVASAAAVFVNSEWASPDTDLAINRKLNDFVAECQGTFAGRIVGSFTLPLQSIELSLRELERAVDQLRLRVANIPANVQGTYVGDRSLWPVWEALCDKDVVVFMHPHGVKDPWYLSYGLWNSVGQAVEETRALSSMIYEGLFDQLPDIKLVISHGRGYLPHYYGRHDRNVQNMPDSAGNIARLPSDYLRSIYYDTCVYAPEVLAALVDHVGAERLVMGSDYPVGDPDPVGFVDRCPRLTGGQAAMVKGGTAAALLGLA